jgi:hypothetical protein
MSKELKEGLARVEQESRQIVGRALSERSATRAG